VDPKRAHVLSDIDEPNWKKSITDNEEPMIALDLNDSALPKHIPSNNDTADPMRAQDRKANDEPIWMKSTTASEDPSP
jgi:hypothetical protein